MNKSAKVAQQLKAINIGDDKKNIKSNVYKESFDN